VEVIQEIVTDIVEEDAENKKGHGESQEENNNKAFCSNCQSVNSVCDETKYCSKECQKQHWKTHPPVCKIISTCSSRIAFLAMP
jgi:hypothetical protein